MAPPPTPKGDLVARSVAASPPTDRADVILSSELEKLAIKGKTKTAEAKAEPASPADFFHLHRLRTSALAHKTNTTSTYGAHNPELNAELRGLSLADKKPKKPNTTTIAATSDILKDDERDSGNEDGDESNSNSSLDEKKVVAAATETTKEDDEEEEEEGGMIARTPGPVQPSRCGRLVPAYPYASAKRGPKPVVAPGCVMPNPSDFWQQQQRKKPQMAPVTPSYEMYGQAQSQQTFFSSPSCEYQGPGIFAAEACLGNVQSYSPCSTSAEEAEAAASNSPSCGATSELRAEKTRTALPESPFADGLVSTDELSRLLDVPTELPDDLSDFILKYSRRYSTDTPPAGLPLTGPLSGDEWRSESRKSSSSSSSASSSPKHRPLSLSEEPPNCDSPISAVSAPQPSPAQPKGAASPDTPNGHRLKNILPKALTPPSSARKGKARDRLRALFGETENEIACLWAVKCIQSCPGALYFRDPDGDSLLHIVVWHKDLPKIYALVELMLKTEFNQCQKPFDLPNRLHETPLFLAVEKRMEEVVSYLLEAGANPNFQTRKAEADAPLHYAAARGMAEIVDVLCAAPATDANLRNGLGLTPLLAAVKNHGVIEEESQCLVNNKPTIRALLRAGADPKVPDAQTGKTVLHYSVERMDPDLVQIYRDNLEPDVMAQVANIPSFSGETPIALLQRIGASGRPGGGAGGRLEAEEELRRKMMVTLLSSGALPPADNAAVIPHSPNSPYDSFDN